MASTTITLIEPFAWFDKQLTQIVLKSPTGLTYMKYGEPRFGVVAPDGAQYWVEKDDVVAQYIRDLLTLDGETAPDGGETILRAMGLADVIQIKEALFDFFTGARVAISVRNSTT